MSVLGASSRGPLRAMLCAAVLAALAGAQGGCSASSSTPAGPGGGGGGASGAGGSGASGGGSAGAGGVDSPPAWETVFSMHELGRAVLSVRGTGPNDVWVVGGPLGNTGYEALALRYDGASWHDLAPGGADTFWWSTATSTTDAWLVGEKGRITHWNGAAFQEYPPITAATLYGAWAASPTDVWAVGGTTGGGPGPKDVVLHWDGVSWSAVTLPDPPLGITLFKVWGAGSDDVYVVGELSVIWHKKGATWQREDAPKSVHGSLLTVNGCSANEVYAVGESNVLRSDGASWTKLDVSLTSRANGVACNAPGDVVVVGSGGVKQRLVAGAWIDEADKPPFVDLHAAWADGAGTFWAVGGDFVGAPEAGKPREGVVARYGRGHASKTLTQLVRLDRAKSAALTKAGHW